MRYIVLIVFFLAGINCNSQSLEEMTDWILDQYKKYERPINTDNELIIENGILYYKMALSESHGFWHQFYLKDIKEIEITKEYYDSEEKISWTSIWIYFDPYVSKIKDFDETKPPGDYYLSDTPGCYILFDASFVDDGMAPQMEDALAHLIKLHGGNAEIIRETD